MTTIYTKENPRPIPEGLYLGDLSNVKAGDEVTIIKNKGGSWVVSASVCVVHLVEDWRVKVRNPNEKLSHHAWLKKNSGGCPYAMHSQDVMRFYYSANSAHIAQAKLNAQNAISAKEAEKKENIRKINELKKDLDDLLKKYGASLCITFGEGSDTHGIYDEAIEVSIGCQSAKVTQE